MVQSSGAAFPHTGMTRMEITNAAGSSRKLLVITNTGDSGTLMMYVHNTATPFVSVHTVPTMSANASAGGPSTARAMKCSLTLVNNTRLMDLGGKIYTLVANQRTIMESPSTMTQAQWTSFTDDLIAHPHTKCWSGSDFQKPKTLLCHPSNIPDYTSFDRFNGTLSADQFALVVSAYSTLSKPRPMSTIYVVMESPATNNVYTATARGSWYARWPLDTIMGQSMKDMPTAPQADINLMQDHAEHNKDQFAPSYSSSAAASAVTTVAGYAAGMAMGRMGPRRRPQFGFGA